MISLGLRLTISGGREAVIRLVGTAAGFGIFFAVRTPIAAIPFTGIPFFPSELSLSVAGVLLVAFGVPLAAAAARIALRRVHITPLGVARRVTPKAPRAWRLVPLLAGLAELGFFVAAGRPATTAGQIQAYLPGFALIMIGLITGGPWLTMTGARIMARRTSRPGGLIAARRLADDPRTGFRAVSGLILALFVTTIAVALIGTQDAKRSGPIGGAAAANVLADHFNYGPPGTAAAPSAALLARLHQIAGVQGNVRRDERIEERSQPRLPAARGRGHPGQPAHRGLHAAASVAAGLADRKRPFSLLRLTGAPLGMLRRVVALESAVPLLAVAVVSTGIAFGAAAMYATMEMQHPLVAPGVAYYVITAAGLVASLAIIAATFPLLRRITSPEAARNE